MQQKATVELVEAIAVKAMAKAEVVEAVVELVEE